MRDCSSEARYRQSPDLVKQKAQTKKVQNYFFKLDNLLGKGNFSSVYRGVHEFTKEVVAIKVVEMSRVHSQLLRDLLHSEIEILKRLWHPNILKCYEVFFSANHCYIVTEYCNDGDLATLVRQRGPYNQESAVPLMSGIFEGLKYLNQEGIVHRDFKMANIFLKNGIPKIADFGFAKKSRQRFKDANIGSPLFMSPESLLHGYYGPKTDIWAFGIMVYQLLHGNHVFQQCRTEQELRQVLTKPLKQDCIDVHLGEDLKELIVRCLETKEVLRPTLDQVAQMKFIRSMYNSVKEVNLLVSQVQEFTQKSLESTEALSRLDKESKRGQKVFDLNQLDMVAKKSKFSSFDLKVNSPKGSSHLQPHKHKRASDNLHIPEQRQKEKQRQARDGFEMRNLRCFSIAKDRGKNDSHIKDSLPNYKSVGSIKNIYQSPKSRLRKEKIIQGPLKFQGFIAFLHYCRLLFRTIKLSAKLQVKDLDVVVSWLFSVIEELEEKLQSPEAAVTSEEQLSKLKQVTRDYRTKYKKDLLSRRKLEASLQQNQAFILTCLQTVGSTTNEKDERKSNLRVSVLGHLIFLYDTNQLLKKAFDSKDYGKFSFANKIQDFLVNEAKSDTKNLGRVTGNQ